VLEGSTPAVERTLTCAECGRESELDAAGRRAFLDDDDQAVTFCQECSHRELGGKRTRLQ
jgi:DNA-directed RNA polymerase subunit RPC12/RpoP